jgi:AcrR family transcriptional regulator
MSDTPEPSARENDPRYQRTRQQLLAAVVELIDADPAQTLSITRLVEAAGVTRPTFYQHFSDVPTALQHAAMARLADAYPPFIPRPDGNPIDQQVYAHALPPLRHLDQHRSFYLRAVETAASAAFFDKLVQFVSARILTDITTPAELTEIAEVVAGGSMWLVVRWLRGDVSGTPEDIARRLVAMAPLIHPPQFQRESA